MFRKLLISILISFAFLGCNTPKIDTSSDEKMKNSIEEISKKLSDDKRKEFKESLEFIYLSQVDFKNILALGSSASVDKIKDDTKVLLNNKTADEVILEAKKIKEKRFEADKQKALKEIDTLENKKKYSDQSVEILKKVQLISGSIDRKDSGYKDHKNTTITLSIKNNTDNAIASIYSIATVKSENREVPWIKEYLNFSISGGIQPGETVEVSLPQNMFSSWGTVNITENATLGIQFTRIDGANGVVLASTQEFTEENSKKLNELKNKYLNK